MTQLAKQHKQRAPGSSTVTAFSTGMDIVLLVGVVAALILTALLFNRFTAPPLWDAAWSTSAGAAELSQNGFDYATLLSAPPFDQGGSGTHASSLLTPLLGAFFVLFGSPGGVIAGHVLMVIVGSALVASTFSLVRRYLALVPALAVAGAVLLLPLIVQQVADPYVELPLALFTMLAVVAFLDGRRVRAALFAGLAIWFKPTGLILLPLIAFIGPCDEPRRWVKNGLALIVAAAPFSIEMLSRSIATHAGATPSLNGTLPLIVNAIWILGVTTDVLVILVLYCLGSYRRRNSHRRLIRATALVTVGFFALHVATMVLSQAVTILPRYYVAVLPIWLVVVAVDLVESHSKRVGVGAMLVLMAFSLVNWNGTFYPLPDHPQAPMAERTPGGGRTYLEMEIEGTRALVDSADSVDLIISGQAMQFRLRYPELGFVSDVPGNVVLGPDLESDPPGSYAWVEEPHIPERVLTPAEVAVEMGWEIERSPLWDQRWQSDLVIVNTS
jgi:hypothetical protein